MKSLVITLQIAGALHWILILVSFLLPDKLDYEENLKRVSPVIRQIFHAQHYLIVLVLAAFGGVSLFFTSDLATGSAIGRFLSAFIGLFWILRLGIQLFYYDPEVRRQHRLGDLAYTLIFIFQSAVFSAAATKGVLW